MAPGFWQTLISIAEVRKKCLEIESCKSKPMDSFSAWQPGIADEADYRKKP